MADAADHSRKMIMSTWLEGWMVLGRLMRFLVWLWLALIPAKLLDVLINPSQRPMPIDTLLRPATVAAIAIILIYLPLALYFASAMSGHLRAKEPPAME